MILLKLFTSFLKIGLLAFGGGYAILPFIQDIVVNNNNWISIKEMTDIVTISQMTPGPVSLNAATFVGTKMAGIPGSIVATSGIIIPQIIIMVILANLYFGNRELKFMHKIIKSLRPAIASLIFIATLDMIKGSLFNNTNFDFLNINYIAIICFIIGGILYYKKLGIIKTISIGAVLGVVLSVIFLH